VAAGTLDACHCRGRDPRTLATDLTLIVWRLVVDEGGRGGAESSPSGEE